MPAAVVSWVGSTLLANTLVGATLMMYSVEIGTALSIIGGLAYSSSKARKAKQEAKDQYNAAQVDRIINLTSATAPRDLVLGRVRKGGVFAYKASTGTNQQDLYLAIALAGHEIDAVEQIYLDDVAVTLDASGNVLNSPWNTSATLTGAVQTGAGYTATLPSTYVPGSVSATYPTTIYTSGADRTGTAPCSVSVSGLTATSSQPNSTITYQYTTSSSNVQITVHLGQPGQTADAQLMAAFGSAWPAVNVMEGVAYLVARLRYSETSFPSGVPNITARIRGAKVYDPRNGLTAWSDNPALLARHVYQHPKFGKAVVTAAEDARFIASANACDISTIYTVGGVAQPARALYKAGLVAEFGTAPKSVLDDLYQAMGGSWAFAGGEFFSQVGVYTAPVMHLTDEDLAVVQRNGASESQNAINISVHTQRADQFNTVKPTIWDEQKNYKETPITPLVGTALLAKDGVSLVENVSMPAVSYAPQALHVAGILMRDARDPLVVSLPFKLRAYPLELFDNVTLTLSRYGWTNKVFRIIERTWNPDATLQLTLKETSAAITQMDAGFSAEGFAENTNLPKPWQVAKVGNLLISSGTDELLVQQDGTIQSRMRITWPQVPDAAVQQDGQVEIQYRPANSTGSWASLVVPGDETQAITADVQDGQVYIVRARARTKIAIGDWGIQKQHQVLGKTEPPPYVDRFKLIEQPGGVKQFFWQMDNKPVDLFAFQVRYSLGTIKRDWESMIPLFAKDAEATSHENQEPANDGTYTFAIRGVDTSGILSAQPHYITETLDGDVFGPVKLLILPQELDWPGTKTNCTIDGTELSAVGTLTWADFNLSWADAAGTEWRNTSPSYIQYEHPVIDTGASISRTIRASALVGGSLVIEYSYSADNVTFSAWDSVPTAAMTSRYFKFRWTVTGSFPRIYRAQVVFY